MAFLAVALLGVVLLIGPSNSQDPIKKPKGMIPDGWKGLELTPAQKEKIYGIQATYKVKIAAMEEQLRAQQTTEMVNVLTDTQKEKLRKALGLGTELKKSEN